MHMECEIPMQTLDPGLLWSLDIGRDQIVHIGCEFPPERAKGCERYQCGSDEAGQCQPGNRIQRTALQHSRSEEGGGDRSHRKEETSTAMDAGKLKPLAGERPNRLVVGDFVEASLPAPPLLAV